MKTKPTQREIIDAISALSAAIKANTGHQLGDEDVIELANKRLKELIPLVRSNGQDTGFSPFGLDKGIVHT